MSYNSPNIPLAPFSDKKGAFGRIDHNTARIEIFVPEKMKFDLNYGTRIPLKNSDKKVVYVVFIKPPSKRRKVGTDNMRIPTKIATPEDRKHDNDANTVVISPDDIVIYTEEWFLHQSKEEIVFPNIDHSGFPNKVNYVLYGNAPITTGMPTVQSMLFIGTDLPEKSLDTTLFIRDSVYRNTFGIPYP